MSYLIASKIKSINDLYDFFFFIIWARYYMFLLNLLKFDNLHRVKEKYLRTKVCIVLQKIVQNYSKSS